MKKLILVIGVVTFGFNAFSQTRSAKELEENLNKVFESYTQYNRFSGNVIISQGNKIIYSKSMGFANIDTHKKNKKNSIFSIASVTKPLTAVGIMTLIDNEKLTLETPISAFFPNFIPKYSKKITIRHLLNHSSGMQANIGRIDDDGNGFMPGKNKITLDELFNKFKDSKLNFEPGTGYEYNNFGYTLLANIIERLSNKSYAAYMEEAVFKPAGMKNTAVDRYKSIHKRAFPHTGLGMDSFKTFQNELNFSGVKGAGNITSTTGDLYHFLKALENGKLVTPASLHKLYNNTQPMGYHKSQYGLGWRIENKGGERWINHTGLLPGYTSIIGMLPKRDLKIIILTNATSTDLTTAREFKGKNEFVSTKIIDAVIAVLQGKEPKLLPTPIDENTTNSPNFSRTYKMDNTHSLVFTKQGATYSLKTIGSEAWSVFTYPFSRDATGKNKVSTTGLVFANAMSTQNFEGLEAYANTDMKELFISKEGLGMLKGIWRRAVKSGGKFRAYNIYKIEGTKGAKIVRIRFHFEKSDIGLLLGINSAHQIQGLFKDTDVKTCHIQKVTLTHINNNDFFINGHQNDGMQDLRIKIVNKELFLIDGKTTFKASLHEHPIKN